MTLTVADDKRHHTEDDQRKEQTVDVETHHLVQVDATLKQQTYQHILTEVWYCSSSNNNYNAISVQPFSTIKAE